MPEWTACPQCQLKHSLRADGLCPRCSTPVAEPGAGGETAHDRRPVLESTLSSASRARDRDDVGLGARIAGAVLVANGLALMIEAGLGVTMGQGAEASAGFRPSPIAMLFDLVLGGMLLTGNAKALLWTKIRVVLGGLLLPALFFARGESLSGSLQLAFSVGLALLLFGEAGRIRIAVGLLATGLMLALETVGLVGMATGTTPLAGLQYAAGLEGGPVEGVDGVACPYRLTAPGGHWYLRKAEVAHEDNPLSDRWLVWPERDAHVFVIAEQVEPDLVVDLDRFAEVVLDNARNAAPDLEVMDSQPLASGGLRLHTRGTINGIAIESYYGLYAREPWIFQVYAFTTDHHFDAVKDDLAEIVVSFEGPQY